MSDEYVKSLFAVLGGVSTPNGGGGYAFRPCRPPRCVYVIFFLSLRITSSCGFWESNASSVNPATCAVVDAFEMFPLLTTPTHRLRGKVTVVPCIMKHDSWTLSKFRWRKEKKSEVPPRTDNKAPEKPAQPTLVSQMDPGVDTAVVARYKRNRYMDRKVSLRTLGPTAPDAASLHTTAAAAATGPPLVPFLPPRSVLRGGFGRYQGPLSQWQIAADMYIDSDIRKRGRLLGLPPLRLTAVVFANSHARRRVVSHSSGEAKAPMVPVERVEKRPDRPPAEPCPRREDVDREMGLPRRRLVLKGPLHATSYSHWYSRVFSPASSSNEDC
ncbi:hypothetical protein HPB50_015740 [Hyalomma asiaticum]|uniref:Uncharacterized protein n=1 Tax=Hyalomma asiaticum TaxID=266040 RepID=A0ACB7SWK4_HYAAI|nr:hypothetical protein HPB50_015740 [Hyalomma asiaticum]